MIILYILMCLAAIVVLIPLVVFGAILILSIANMVTEVYEDD